jgi:hypothetical protein
VATLKLGQEIRTREPQVELDPELRPGRYSVRLVIEGARGASAAAQIELIVTERGRTPIGPLTPVRPPTPVRPFAPIARVTEIPEAAVTAAMQTSTSTPTPTLKAKPKAKKKAKAPVKAKTPVKPPKKDKRK